jgi:hypothetical protein
MNKKIIIAILFLASCGTKFQKPNAEFLQMLNQDKNNKIGLNYSGYYYSIKKRNETIEKVGEHLDAVNPLFFFKNGLILFDNNGYRDSTRDSNSFIDYSSKIGFDKNWGTYKIENDTIKAIIYFQFFNNNAQRIKYYLTFFEGTIYQNQIFGWHMVKPFPKISKKFNGNIIEENVKLEELTFKSFPAKLLIDSNKVWFANETKYH